MIASAVTLFPEPDSPTMASVFPRVTDSDRPSTAVTRPSSVGNRTCRSLTVRYGSWDVRTSGLLLSGCLM